VKLASLVLALSGSLLVANLAAAQEAAYASPQPQPVYASQPQPAANSGAPGTIKDRGTHDRPLQLSAQLYIPWFWGIGIGVKLGAEIPVVKDGFISSINDSFAIEPAFYLAYSNYYGSNFYNDDVNLLQYTIAVAGIWNFHLKPNLTVYGALSLGVVIRDWTNIDDRYWNDSKAAAFVELAPGVKWKFHEKIALRAELGWYGPRAGIAVDL
jgi:hypothetical protein